ncbi:hypothetical protein NQ317_017979 [Molorchus minor]|uniref:Uncharacterized protein n=1 Tax=Molorchus minor TaxID=1323400 RepID=A0ABQ9IUI7_9CUCU|nr:hypothetical protein NQ317_017979 [Molorchus minor]
MTKKFSTLPDDLNILFPLKTNEELERFETYPIEKKAVSLSESVFGHIFIISSKISPKWPLGDVLRSSLGVVLRSSLGRRFLRNIDVTMTTACSLGYNITKNMSGIDRQDQMLAYYISERKTIRWYKKAFHSFHINYASQRFPPAENQPSENSKTIPKQQLDHLPEKISFG